MSRDRIVTCNGGKPHPHTRYCVDVERRHGEIIEYSPTIKQAFRDWNEHRAYLDNGGNYRVRSEPATPTHRPSGKIAPWNREVKRLFADSGEFHRAAKAWEGRQR